MVYELYLLFAILENKGEKVFVLSNTALLPFAAGCRAEEAS
jgi:hypothetical protein